MSTTLKIKKDYEIGDKDSAPWDAIVAFAEGGDGPDPDSLTFAMTVSVDDPWNIRCVEILSKKLREKAKGMEGSAGLEKKDRSIHERYGFGQVQATPDKVEKNSKAPERDR